MPEDNRPYAEVEICGRHYIGLLDSGAQNTVVGKNFEPIIKDLKLKMHFSPSIIKTADGTAHSRNFLVLLPIIYNGRSKIINAIFAPSIEHSIIFGIDFWEAFSVRPILCETIETPKTLNVSETHELSPDLAQQLQTILREMPFSNPDGILSKTTLIKHHIDTGEALPIKQAQYTMSPYVQKDVYVEIDRLLTIGAIYRCPASPWNNPMVAVKKPNGKIRLCIDARKLNNVTKKDAYPIQQMNRILARLTGTKVLSAIDFSDAYLQVELDVESQPKTAFSVSGKGYFAYARMPFGLCNSGATLCRLVDSVIGCDLEPHVFVYLDDIIVATNTFEQHFQMLDILQQRLRAAGLTISSEKSRFCMRRLNYLGYIIDENGVSPDREKISCIDDYPVPKTVKDVRRLIGLAGWYRRFIPNFSTITAPLTEITKKGRKFEWNESADKAMAEIKKILVSAPILSNPDYEKPFVIQTDASDIGMGGVLVQGEGEDERVIAYTSAKFSATQRNYQTTERECLAVITAIEKFRPYIEGTTFTVVTDHASLLWLKNLKDPTGRLCRWSLRLQPYNFKLVHRKGSHMVVADALSRAIDLIDIYSFPVAADKWYDDVVYKVKVLPEKYSNFKIENDVLYKHCERARKGLGNVSSWRIVVPTNRRNIVMTECHVPPLKAHGGFHKTIDRVRRQFYWPNMDSDVRNFVRGCDVCKAAKHSNVTQRAPMGEYREACKPWRILYMDFVGPLPRSKKGHCHILTVVDSFSKFVHAHPLRNANATALVNFVEDHIFLKFGVPECVISDNGCQFVSLQFRKLLESYKVKFMPVSRYHPQANAAEAVNKTLVTSIRAYIKDDHREWDVHLQKIVCAINSSMHSSTKFTPYFVNFGQRMITSGLEHAMSNDIDAPTHDDDNERLQKIREIVKENLKKSYDVSKKRYDLRARPISYNAGDIVWKVNTKLSNAVRNESAKFFGYVKCRIKKKVGSCSYELEDMSGQRLGIFSTDMIKQ